MSCRSAIPREATFPGHEPVEATVYFPGPARVLRLWPASSTPEGMVFVSGRPYAIGVARQVTLPDFWIH